MFVVKSLTSSIIIALRENPGSYGSKDIHTFHFCVWADCFLENLYWSRHPTGREWVSVFSIYFYNHWQFVMKSGTADIFIEIWLLVKVKHFPLCLLPTFISLISSCPSVVILCSTCIFLVDLEKALIMLVFFIIVNLFPPGCLLVLLIICMSVCLWFLTFM